jgi:hypothetical protein
VLFVVAYQPEHRLLVAHIALRAIHGIELRTSEGHDRIARQDDVQQVIDERLRASARQSQCSTSDSTSAKPAALAIVASQLHVVTVPITTAATAAETGSVTTHAVAMRPSCAHSSARAFWRNPAPTMAPVDTCVVETGSV